VPHPAAVHKRPFWGTLHSCIGIDALIYRVEQTSLARGDLEASGNNNYAATAIRARTPVAPGGEGQIDIRGEIWRAESAVALEPGTAVRVLAVNGLTLMVEPAGAATRQGAD